ncbi:HigA family addiction module antitoxin [Luteolibacter sp. Populi]|uniref:HigA family addiction module antitoxin n=1 Tax=Luteolibacter sp. Populi TaxID=3230487 RepID=UPI003465E50C
MKRKPELIPLLNFFAETLRETLKEQTSSQAEIARRTGIPAPHLTQMKQGKRRCTPEYDLRLSRYFGVAPGMWVNLQTDYELRRAEREKGETIRREVRPQAA